MSERGPVDIAQAIWALRAYADGKKLEPATLRELYLAGYIGIDLQSSRKELHPTVITEKGRQLGRNSTVQASGQMRRRMSDFKAGQHITVKLSGGRLVDAEIKAIIDTEEGKRLQVSFGNDETARIYLWQLVEKLR
jgi:hypothetical protein